MITSESSLGRYLLIVKKGTLARMRVIDFTRLSFRKIDAPFEGLELHFPDGDHPVHTDDLTPGMMFPAPSVSELIDIGFQVKAVGDVVLLALDADYFKIVVGSTEIEKLRQSLKSTLTENEVVRIWVNAEKQRRWDKFKKSEIEKAKKEYRTDWEFRTQQLAIRKADVPTALRDYKPKKVVPYCSKSLRS
jgi:hypothetical protein